MTQAPIALQTIVAANPSPLTGQGTNSFLLGRDQIAVIDPGPDLPEHRQAIIAAAGAGRITHILVTHAHLDHSQGARALADATGATVYGFGPALAGRSPLMQRLAREGALDGGEGLDMAFVPDIQMRDGDRIETPEWTLTAIHTPGHFAGHLSFQSGGDIFCGDVVMDWSSTLISPPDGDLADYFRSLSRLRESGAARLLPAHGDPIENPTVRIAELAAHRRKRTAQILASLRDSPATAEQLAHKIYAIPPHLIPAATRNVLAHLIALSEIGAIAPLSPIGTTTIFASP
ncbi:MBL fold metallo-hydrolase [Paracoccus aestuariivivens]|uniref:MBL fold metallo-hydrolase n=1 Tax=Paracoccus aestuariivivens TaxID=1820333 RepID=A0A6L6JCW6_9RHOB|nr:MBL fold metallo-hydrolase [Paracoccus aestuariivivens]MTH79346.1 MBL fold metallo-hydrolase [Paracoccus aestuariivivens]